MKEIPCVHSKGRSKDLLLAQCFSLFLRETLVGFLSFPSLPTTFSFYYDFSSLHQISVSFATQNSFSSDTVTLKPHEGRRERNMGWIAALGRQPSMAVGNWSSRRQCCGLYWRGEAAGNGARSTDAELPFGMREIRMTAVERSSARSKESRWNKEAARGLVTETNQKLQGGPACLCYYFLPLLESPPLLDPH